MRSAPKTKPKPQNAHRLVVIAHKTEDEITRLLQGEQASHLCHKTTCINPDHIVVETKARNEQRKGCRAMGPTIITTFEGRELVLLPNGQCKCDGGKCIFMIERRVAHIA